MGYAREPMATEAPSRRHRSGEGEPPIGVYANATPKRNCRRSSPDARPCLLEQLRTGVTFDIVADEDV